MTRNVTVEFEDGSSHVYADAPDDVTPEQVTDRAQKEFSKKVTHLDGGKKAPAKPAAKPATEDDHSAEEYEAPLAKVGINYKGIEQKLKAVEAEPLWKQVLGVGQAAASQAAGLGMTIAGGLVGGAQTAGALAGGANLDEATKVGSETIKKAQGMAYQPGSATGQAINETINYAGSIPGAATKEIGGGAGELIGGDKGRAAGEAIGEALPSAYFTVKGGKGALKNAPEPYKGSSRGESMLRKAMADFTPEELEQADKILKESVDKGIPLTGPQAFPEGTKLHELALKADKSNPIIANFLKTQPEKARAAIKKELSKVGEKVGLQAAADTTQEVATKAISDTEKERTAAVKSNYDAAKAGDKEALQLMDDIAAQTADIDAGTKWKNDAVQQAGKWYKFTHDMGLKANEVASKMKEWTGTTEEKQALADMEAEGGKANPKVEQVNNLLERRKEGQAATQAAVDAAAERQGFLDKWKEEVDQKSDQLAEHRLPEIQEKVQGFMQGLDEEIKLVHPDSTAGKILTKFKNSIAPDGKPLTLPSQLEAAYKTARSALDVGISSTSEERQASGVLKDHVKNLDALIKDVSPEIKAGRELYEEISRTVVDPLKKGPLGKLAGKGADAQKEASHTRMLGELQSDTADPTRIAKIADEFNKVDKTAFPNAVRAWLELKFDKAAKVSAADPKARLTGAKLADSIAASPQEKANLSTAIQKVAEAQGASKAEARKAAIGASTFLQMLRSTGNIKGLGLQGVEEGAGLAGTVAGAAANSHSYGFFKSVGNKAAEVVNKGAYENLAKIFTDPEAVQKMVKLAGLKAENKAARQAMLKDILTLAAAPTLAPNQPTAQGKEKPKGTQ